jgi:hypothetical protein
MFIKVMNFVLTRGTWSYVLQNYIKYVRDISFIVTPNTAAVLMETCICRDIPRLLHCSGNAPSNAHWKSYFVLGITGCSSESKMSRRMFWFIRNLFLNLFCHYLITFPTHSRVYKSVSEKGTLLSLPRSCYHSSYLKIFRYQLIFSIHNTYTTPINCCGRRVEPLQGRLCFC